MSKKFKSSKPTSVRFNPIAADRLRIMSNYYGVSQSKAIEMAVMSMPIPRREIEQEATKQPASE